MAPGFSIIKLLTASAVFILLLFITHHYFARPENPARPDRQAQKIIDVFQEARRKSFAEGEIMRVEVDLTDNAVRMVDENLPANAADDLLVKEIPLMPPKEVRINARPQEIPTDPTEIMPVPAAQFRRSKYSTSQSHEVCTFRFLSDGTIFNEGTDNVGTNATTVGLTLYLWTPKFTNGRESETARAITVIGGTGSIRFWEYRHQLNEVNKWKDAGELIYPNDRRAAAVQRSSLKASFDVSGDAPQDVSRAAHSFAETFN